MVQVQGITAKDRPTQRWAHCDKAVSNITYPLMMKWREESHLTFGVIEATIRRTLVTLMEGTKDLTSTHYCSQCQKASISDGQMAPPQHQRCPDCMILHVHGSTSSLHIVTLLLPACGQIRFSIHDKYRKGSQDWSYKVEYKFGL